MDNNNNNPQPTAPLSNPGNSVNNSGNTVPPSTAMSPTHFDDRPSTPVMPVAKTAAETAEEQATKKAKIYMILAIIFGAFAFIGIVVGIWSLISYTDASNKITSLNSKLATADAIISKVEEETGTKITSVDTVPAYTAVSDYIYVSAWGIKFEIPNDLESLSYTLDQKYRPQICFAAYQTGIQYFPAFADIDRNTSGLGCVTRVASYEGDTDADTGASFGQPIYSYGEYNYFYSAPGSHYSEDAAEQGLEDTATQIIKNMLVNTISHFE